MDRRRRRAPVAMLALVSAISLVVSGCSSNGSSDPNGPITLTLATFGDFGYTQQLLDEYTKEHPNIKIVQQKAAGSDDARNNFFTKLAAGSGLADVEAMDRDWFTEAMQFSNKFYDLSDPSLENRWVDWKYDAALDSDGRLLGYGTDIGPQAVCYRTDLFAAAGLPTSRDEVAALLQGDWNHYFDLGRKYTTETGEAWFDSPSSVFQGMINQVQYAFEDESGKIIAHENPEVEQIFRTVAEQSLVSSAGLSTFTDDWFAALKNSKFATELCPAWMLGIISGNAPDVKGWDIANVYPGGGGNWGGSYLSVPAQSEYPEEAKAFANWLTAPDQQIQAFVNAGPFPSQVEAYENPELLEYTSPYFSDAPAGEIYIDRAQAIAVKPFKGPNYFKVYDIITSGLARVAQDKTQNVDDSWQQVLSEIRNLG